MKPPSAKWIRALVEDGTLSAEQGEWAEQVPVASFVTAEADSGGHTDNRPMMTLLPAMLALRDRLPVRGDAEKILVGAAGGLSTPQAVAAVVAMGADYIVTGSVNQSCREAGTCEEVRAMLATARQADTMMAPAADMFEMGVKVQVLKRGTMFPMRANKLYEIYRSYSSVEQIPADERKKLEMQIFRQNLDEVWQQTQAYFAERDPAQIERANSDAKHKMALIFRSYLGLSSHWANGGQADRRLDYQVWCGPAMGAFNEWAKDSPLAAVAGRDVVTVALNLMYGAAVVTRLQWLKTQGAVISQSQGAMIRPQAADTIREKANIDCA